MDLEAATSPDHVTSEWPVCKTKCSYAYLPGFKACAIATIPNGIPLWYLELC